MLRRSMYLCHTICALTIANSSISALQAGKSNPHQNIEKCKGPHQMWTSMRYTTPEGIGYKTGYTTLEGFFSFPQDTWVPFLDLRGHVFDNGKLAANAGLGLRYLTHSRVFGVNPITIIETLAASIIIKLAEGLKL